MKKGVVVVSDDEMEGYGVDVGKVRMIKICIYDFHIFLFLGKMKTRKFKISHKEKERLGGWDHMHFSIYHSLYWEYHLHFFL